jgi:4-amino-4-deoxy-L-arabinose transferase-like glycosyltransferase
MRAPDSASYLHLAESLHNQHAFASDGVAEVVRTPGYPLWLVAGIWSGHLEPYTWVSQAILGALVVVLVGVISQRLAGSTAGWWSAALMACEPLSIIFTGAMLSEPLFTACLMAAVAAGVCACSDPSSRTFWVSALALAAATFVRPISYYLPLVWCAVWIVSPPRFARESQQRFRWALVWLIASGLPLGIWQLRNWQQLEYPKFSAIGDINRYFYQGAAAQAVREGSSLAEVQAELGYRSNLEYLTRHPEQSDWTTPQRFRFMSDAGTEMLKASPGISLRLHAQGMLRTLGDPGATTWLKAFGRYPQQGGLLNRVLRDGVLAALRQTAAERPALVALMAGLGAILAGYWLAALAGWWSLRSAWSQGVGLLTTTLLYLALAAGGPQAEARFRHPIMPLVCVFAGVGLASSGIAGIKSPALR